MLRVVTTTDYLLADIANTLRKMARLPPVQVKTDGEIIIPDDKVEEKKPKEKPKRASAPKEKPAKVEEAGAPAKPAKKTGKRKSGRKKK